MAQSMAQWASEPKFRFAVLEECDSTNEVAKQWAEDGAAHGSWVMARRQTQGRGRLGRRWESPAGNLYLSVVLRPRMSRGWGWVSLAVACAAARAVEELAPRAQVRIKWPNDLWLESVGGDRAGKCGGILCEASWSAQAGCEFVVAGVGVNGLVAPSPDGAPGLDLKADAQADLKPQKSAGWRYPAASVGVVPEALRPAVWEQVMAQVAALERWGPAVVSQEYEKRALIRPGDALRWEENGVLEFGRAVGLGPEAELIVETQSGRQKALWAADVSLGSLA